MTEEPGGVPGETGEVQAALIEPDECPKFKCGVADLLANGAPVVLNSSGSAGLALADGSGIEFLGVRVGEGAAPLELVGDRIVARDGTDTKGSPAIGAQILLSVDDSVFAIAIEDEQWLPFATGDGYFPVYSLTFTGCGETAAHFCANAGNQAVLLSGDAYDPTGSDVVEARDAVTIACVGSTVANLHQRRYTASSSTATYPSTPDQRSAMYKLLRGDYCGNGLDNGDVTSVAIGETQRGGWMPDIVEFEAMWNKDGATCIGTPRHGATLYGIGCNPRPCGFGEPPWRNLVDFATGSETVLMPPF